MAGINFKDIYTRYSEIRREKPIMLTTDWETELAEAVYPFIRDAYTKLGDQRVKALKYRVGAIQDALTAMSKKNSRRYTTHWASAKGQRQPIWNNGMRRPPCQGRLRGRRSPA